MGECPFCDLIAAGDYFHVTPHVVRFQPLAPVTSGHMLFVPRLHVPSPVENPVQAALAVEAAAHWAVGSQCNIITSSGAAATQTVLHLHVHYVPRRPGDGLVLPWTNQKARVSDA